MKGEMWGTEEEEFFCELVEREDRGVLKTKGGSLHVKTILGTIPTKRRSVREKGTSILDMAEKDEAWGGKKFQKRL